MKEVTIEGHWFDDKTSRHYLIIMVEGKPIGSTGINQLKSKFIPVSNDPTKVAALAKGKKIKLEL